MRLIFNTSFFEDTETVFDIAAGEEVDAAGTPAITLGKNYQAELFTLFSCSEHCVSSSVDLVGLQLWRGAFLLADFLLSQPNLLAGKKVLELAAGTGLTAVTASMMAESVTATGWWSRVFI